jgi:hypothetical protein
MSAMTAVFAAASLLLAGGAGVLSSLLVAPVRGAGRMVALLLASVAALGLGLLLLVGPAEPAFFLTGTLTGTRMHIARL